MDEATDIEMEKTSERQSDISIILENICTFCSQGRRNNTQITTSIKFIIYTTFDPGDYELIIIVRGWHENVFSRG